jgi:hypothetical protein
MHGKAKLLKPLIANIHTALQHVKRDLAPGIRIP